MTTGRWFAVATVIIIVLGLVAGLALTDGGSGHCPPPDRSSDPTWVCSEGPTINGGDYEIVAYLDDSGEPAPRSRSTRVVITEYAGDGSVVHTTWGGFDE